jgi:hypothetical protein
MVAEIEACEDSWWESVWPRTNTEAQPLWEPPNIGEKFCSQTEVRSTSQEELVKGVFLVERLVSHSHNNTPRVSSTPSIMPRKRRKGKGVDGQKSDGGTEDEGQQPRKRIQKGPQSGSGERLFVGE